MDKIASGYKEFDIRKYHINEKWKPHRIERKGKVALIYQFKPRSETHDMLIMTLKELHYWTDTESLDFIQMLREEYDKVLPGIGSPVFCAEELYSDYSILEKSSEKYYIRKNHFVVAIEFGDFIFRDSIDRVNKTWICTTM